MERLKALFDQAVEAPPGTREEILAAACGDDLALQREVQSLLDSDAAAGDFLEQPTACRLALSGDAGFPPPLGPRHQLGRYEIVAFVGAGAVSEVYRARDARLGRTVALLLLTDPTAYDGAAWLLREAQHASTLNHPHICTVHEVDEWEGRPFIVLEHIEGITLHEARRRGPLPMDTMIRWGAEIADARVDIWALGVLLYELASGCVPFRGATAFATASAIIEESPAPLPATVPLALRQVIARCLSKDPATHCGGWRATSVRAPDDLAPPARPWRLRWPPSSWRPSPTSRGRGLAPRPLLQPDPARWWRSCRCSILAATRLSRFCPKASPRVSSRS